MRKHHRIFLLLLAALLVKVDATTQPLQLWYRQPAQKWTEALPLGNGRMGAMVFGGVEKDHIQLNEETLWTGEPRDYNKKNAWRYLDSIRKLLFLSKQKEAEALAGTEFMGLKSNEGKRAEWLQKIFSLQGVQGNPAAAAYDDSQWKTMYVPAFEGWETVGYEGLDGAVWFRTSFNLPEQAAPYNMILDLNRIRNFDKTYINGQFIGSMESDEGRKYYIPASVLRPGKNTIAILVINFDGKGGINGYKDTTRKISVYAAEGEEPDRIVLNGEWKFFVQDDAPPAVGVYQASYQPFGDMWIEMPHSGYTNYQRSLDISKAIAYTSYDWQGVHFTREYFISAPHQLMVTQLGADKTGQVNAVVYLNSPYKNVELVQQKDGVTVMTVAVRNGVLKGKAYLTIKMKGGSLRHEAGKCIISGADAATIFLAAATNFNNYKDVSADAAARCKKALASVQQTTLQQVRTAHINEYRKWFNTFSIQLGKNDQDSVPTDVRLNRFATNNDPAFVALYLQYGRYLLIASSRPGTQPANLQGIWNDLLAPPWGSKYTTNINAEMNYWPAELLNLSPMHQPLFEMIRELSVTGKATAREYYHAPGWVLHHNTDLWRGTAPINASNHGIWVTGGAWLCQHLWEHYLFTQDKIFLQQTAYPVMKSAAQFFQHFLVKDPATGWLISTPSNSPEQGGLVAGPAMDHQIIRALYRNVIEAATLLQSDRLWIDTIRRQLDSIAPDKIGKHGQLQEWMQDIDDVNNKHRHISHLWAVYPGNEINYDDAPALMQAAKQSLLYRGDAATGWSLGWKINCWARFKDGDHSFKLIQMLMSPAKNGAGSYPNLFDAHPPFQIDGNFGGAAGIGELLLQSHAAYIDILPALPTALPDGVVKGICARGGFVCNIEWSNGKLVRCTLRSLAGNKVTLRYNGQVKSIQTQANKTYTFNAALQLQ